MLSTTFDCRIQAGNGGKLRCSQAKLTQTIKAAVDMFASISCQYPEIEGGTYDVHLGGWYPESTAFDFRILAGNGCKHIYSCFDGLGELCLAAA